MDDLEKYTKNAPEAVRIDRWLMAARFFKTRTQAGKACDGGKVKVNGQTARPGKTVRTGDVVVVQQGGRYRNVTICHLAQRGVPPAVARLLYEEEESNMISEEDQEIMRLQRQLEKKVKRKFKGRPTKKERRDILKFFRE
jgi:ribosome-associated heat shock protein Hsp15